MSLIDTTLNLSSPPVFLSQVAVTRILRHPSVLSLFIKSLHKCSRYSHSSFSTRFLLNTMVREVFVVKYWF